MFKELALLVRHRAVLFTVSNVEDDRFRVNVIPKKITDGENDALTTPVSVTGTVENLDKELPQTQLYFVSTNSVSSERLPSICRNILHSGRPVSQGNAPPPLGSFTTPVFQM